MDKNLKILAKSSLFDGLKEKEAGNILFYLNPVVRKYKKGNIILEAGSKVTELGIILKGKAQIAKEDIRGNRSIIAELAESSLFAESLACARTEQSPVAVTAETDTEVMFINFDRIMKVRVKTEIADRLIKNMMMLMRLNKGEYSIVQLNVDEGSESDGKLIRDLPIPSGVVLIAIQRGEEVVLPRGNVTIEANDRMLAMVDEPGLKEMNNLFGR